MKRVRRTEAHELLTRTLPRSGVDRFVRPRTPRRTATIAALVLLASVMHGPASGALLCAGREPTILGTFRDDVLDGTRGRDVIVALAGNDIIRSRGGNDVICAGPGDDVISTGWGRDTVNAGRGRDVIAGRSGSDLLRGGMGSDVIAGNTGADAIKGGSGKDVLVGGWGRDLLIGGGGADVASYASVPRGAQIDLKRGVARGKGRDRVRGVESVIGSRHRDVIKGDASGNQLAGGPGADLVVGRAGDDELLPGGGDDRVEGGAGTDLASWMDARHRVFADLRSGRATGNGEDTLRNIENLQGSRSDDELVGDDGDNVLYGTAGDDLLDGRGAFDIASYVDLFTANADLQTGVAHKTSGRDALTGIEGLEASLGGSRLAGDDADNLLIGGPDSDELIGLGGDDELVGGHSGDKFYPGTGSDSIAGGAQHSSRDLLDYSALDHPVDVDLASGRALAEGVDTISGVEEVWATPHDDSLVGGPADEHLEGRDGADSIWGGDGFDRLFGQRGDDRLSGDGWDDFLEGGSGLDELFGGDGHDSLYGDDASTRQGAAEPDMLFGGEGWDRLGGEEGDDTLDGGAGFDTWDGIGMGGTQGVTADLEAGYISAHGTDRVTSVEAIPGTSLDDELRGDDATNFLWGNVGGSDYIEGRGGDDFLQAFRGDDVIVGGPGNDHIATGEGSDQADGGDGRDFCVYAEIAVSCEEDLTASAEVFEGPYADKSWDGYILVRAVSAYLRQDLIIGRIASPVGCDSLVDVYLERKEGEEWRTVRVGLTGPLDGYSFKLPADSGTYRVHALARPVGEGHLCARAVSDEFNL